MKLPLAAVLAAMIAPVSIQAQTFDFEGAAVGTYSTLTQTSGSLTLNLSRQGGLQFRIFDLSPFDGPPSFGSATLDPFGNPSAGAFVADFSSGLSAFSINLGDYGADADVLTLSIFSGLGGTGTLLGTQSLAYSAASTFPDDVATLSLSSATPFLSAVFNGGSTAFPNSVYYDNITATAAAAVPEPASWAMMMFGVGMVGAGLRGRRRSNVTTRVRFA